MAPRCCCDLPLLQLCRANKAPPYTVCLTRTTQVPQDLPLFSIILCPRFSAEVAFPANTANTTAQHKPKVGRNVLLCTQNMTNPSAKPSVGRPVGLALQSCTSCSWSSRPGLLLTIRTHRSWKPGCPKLPVWNQSPSSQIHSVSLLRKCARTVLGKQYIPYFFLIK